MDRASALPPHPGLRIKAEIIPKGMSVTKAADLLAVGRPALSNLLNGNAGLSADMAARIEKAFGCSRDELLHMQAEYDAAHAQLRTAPSDAQRYVPPFLAIKASQIERWVTHNLSARARLPVLLRTLVHSTGRELTTVDFPGNDDAERPGWDGVIEAGEGTPWIPEGRSGWEFGTNNDVSAKAAMDFDKGTRAHSKQQRASITFVFVTPRTWPGKTAWAQAAKRKGGWKDVRAYDASDLEQWFEQSPPAQCWFADETEIPERGVRSLDRCWWEWAHVSTPPLNGMLFAAAIDAAKRKILPRLSSAANGPTVIAADSTDEALAFLAQLFNEDELAAYRDRLLVFDKAGVLSRLAHGSPSFIPVVHTREVERELGPYAELMPSIIVYPRNLATEHHIVLEPISHDTFSKALEAMGKHRDEVLRLTNESGRSLTVLRRRLARLPAVQQPEWAADHDAASLLVPFLLVGAWRTDNDADKTGLSLLAGRSYDELERDCQRLLQMNDAPVWSIGVHRGVVSKLDLLYAIAKAVTLEDLSRYFEIAQIVLSEDDPSLDLAESQRWAAALHRKTRQFSTAFRQGISETLVLLAVHGVRLFESRLGMNTESEAARVVRQLLPTPLATRTLEAHERDLPTYAEAAPSEFLSILEQDLRREDPAILGLLRPAASGMIGRPGRTGLLWALEALAWSHATLARTATILARLAEVEIADNWVNRPIASLQAIFRVWMPQTVANAGARLDLLKKLSEQFPDVAWKICMAQIRSELGIGAYSSKPRWRTDGHGFGEPCETWAPIHEFQRGIIDIIFGWKRHTLATLSDLVERLGVLDSEHQTGAWALIEAWARSAASDADKAILRENIRVSTLSRKAAKRGAGKSDFAALTRNAKRAYEALEPSDLLNKHAWLFRETWVEESADELEELEEFDLVDFEKRGERIQEMRVAALREIRAERGIWGLILLAEVGKAAGQVGMLAAQDVLSGTELCECVRLALYEVVGGTTRASVCKNLIASALRGCAAGDQRHLFFKMALLDLTEEEKAHFLTLAPFEPNTWLLVDVLCAASREQYWSHAVVERLATDSNKIDAIERLLQAGRPTAAFSCIRLEPEKVDVQVLTRVLWEMTKGGRHEEPGEVFDEYDIGRAFKVLDESQLLTLEQKASLEFAYIDVLERSKGSFDDSCCTPNLQRYVGAHPDWYIQSILWGFRRSDDAADPPELQVPAERAGLMAKRGHSLREILVRLPGHDERGELNADLLAAWVATVRESCKALGRAEVADVCLGEMLARAPAGHDGSWPCEPVRQVLEETHSDKMIHGMRIGAYNSRGIHLRGEGGDQERALAKKYRQWAQAIQLSHPYVASHLLLELAKTYEREASLEDIEAGVSRRRSSA